MKNEQMIAIKQSLQQISQEEIAKHWTLSNEDKQELMQYRKEYRLFAAIQICIVRQHGRFLLNCNELSPQITNYLTRQLGLAPTLTVNIPDRIATLTEQRQSMCQPPKFRTVLSRLKLLTNNLLQNQFRNRLIC